MAKRGHARKRPTAPARDRRWGGRSDCCEPRSRRIPGRLEQERLDDLGAPTNFPAW